MIVDEDTYPQEEIKLYKVININQEAQGQVSILGLEYNKDKYENIDNNKNLDEKKFELISDVIKSKESISNPVIRKFTAELEKRKGLGWYHKFVAQWFLVPGADSYEVRFYKDGILLNNLTERLVPSSKTISNILWSNPDAPEFMQKVTFWSPYLHTKQLPSYTYSKKPNETYELSCQVSAIKNGKYSDSESYYTLK